MALISLRQRPGHIDTDCRTAKTGHFRRAARDSPDEKYKPYAAGTLDPAISGARAP